ncbi:PIN domain-containing protein [Sorangium sp. So ce1128]
MKKLFPGSYPLKAEDFKVLWSEGMFVFDTNMLLNVYRYSAKARKEFLNILSSPEVAPRIWIPYQVALEYHRNLDEVRYEQVRKCIDIKQQVEKWGQSSRAGDHKTRAEQLSTLVNQFVEEADKDYRHPDREALIERIAELFEGKVGPEWDQERLKKLYKQGEDRYKDEIPPGFKDRQQKKGDDKYGDLVIWFQIIEEAKQRKKPVIFVIDDRKEDWWLDIGGKTVGPLPALRNEIDREASVLFHMYSGDVFVKRAGEMLNLQVQDETVNEVKRVRQEQEKRHAAWSEYTQKAQILRLLRKQLSNEQPLWDEENQIPLFPDAAGLEPGYIRSRMREIQFMNQRKSLDADLLDELKRFISDRARHGSGADFSQRDSQAKAAQIRGLSRRLDMLESFQGTSSIDSEATMDKEPGPGDEDSTE